MSLLEKFERYPLTFGPTPIEHLPRLTAAIGGKVEIYAKRDDCNSGLPMGGNKLRKLEYIVPDAIASGADTLVSIGGVQSNHTRMVAATAAKIGMKCVVIQEKWVPHYDAVYDRVGNILMTRLMGADASGTLGQTRAQVRKIVDSTAELVRLGRGIREDEIVINPDYAYPAYGVPSEETNAAIRLAARTEAMITDPVYEGKSMQGMIDLARKGFFPEGSRVLYAHLGGAPALNGYSYYYKDG
ncbi:pyridoxal-phosphate dependent enzyme [Ensifer sp. 2YAB10]|uniref:pyridoxal-phosphate dependent enzyme n=1 Tax=Ensifer sp. 2YAB10 TaxID=3233021 RepID=UPI003F8FDD2D